MLTYTPVFTENLDAYNSKLYRAICNEGSSRSSKTYSEMQLMAYISLQPEIFGGKEISVVSPSLPHLKKGARKDFLDIADNWNFFNEEAFNRTDNKYNFKKGYIEFFGADDSKKVRGPGRDILVINEANLISHETYIQLAMRTTETIFLDYNPADEFSYVYAIADKDGNKKIHSTYLNNKGNLSKWQIEEIESLRDADENLWKVYGLGLRGTSSETIYTHWKITDHFPEVNDWCYGLDFGFNHPNALIKVGFDDRAVFWDEIIYESKMTTDDLIYAMKTLGVVKSRAMYCDHARPETIEELRRAGFNAKPADKSVIDGINCVKAKPLYITRSSVNTIKEARSYKWMVDKDGLVKDKEPVKFKDDAMDAGRYGTYTHSFRPKTKWVMEDMEL